MVFYMDGPGFGRIYRIYGILWRFTGWTGIWQDLQDFMVFYRMDRIWQDLRDFMVFYRMDRDFTE